MRFAGCVLAFVIALGLARAQAPASQAAEPAAAVVPATGRTLTTGEAIALGLVEGITEYLPVSSTGHLIITNHLLGLESEVQLTDEAGQPRWIKPPSAEHPAGRPLTVKAAADAFAVVIQVGGIAAVVVLYWNQLWSLLLGALGMDREGAKLLRNIALGILPAVVFGVLLDDWIEKMLFGIWPVIVALVGGAVLMLYVDRRRRQSQWSQSNGRKPSELRPSEALLVGAMQCVAMWPGTSRSMMTIVGGYTVGLKPAQAAEFSFLVGLPTLAGAALLKGAKAGPAMIEVFGWSPVLIGTFVAFVSAAAAIKVLIAALTRFGLAPFAVYRIVLAAVLAGVLLF
ncbi:MAG TPA: undecaprenyl-diphosphate phosphatase [Opitutaceae bacterium]|nr:undecaprenyl-diphosphate phosphatase [Opitutaceae bacterium]